jgi:hypothetical protein
MMQCPSIWANSHGLNLLKLLAKINPYSLEFILSGIFTTATKNLTDTVTEVRLVVISGSLKRWY